MKCKNCGSYLKDNAIRCSNCGAFCGDDNGYVLLATDDRVDDSYYEELETKKQKKKKLATGITIILVLAILISGGLFYYNFIYEKPINQPDLAFKTGTGIINDDEKVIYVTLDDSKVPSAIEYIHGVSIYAYDKTAEEHGITTNTDPVSVDYQYTKDVDGRFRAIFFDTKDLKFKEDTDYTYTFEMKFSFVDSNRIYTYNQLVKFNSEIIDDASDIVFDHSMKKKAEPTTEMPAPKNEEETTILTTTTTTTTAPSIDYIYNGYWYTTPFTEGDAKSISVYKFNSDKTFTSTDYSKKGTAQWSTISSSGTYQVKGDSIVAVYSDGESITFELNRNAKKINGMQNETTDSTQTVDEIFNING